MEYADWPGQGYMAIPRATVHPTQSIQTESEEGWIPPKETRVLLW